MHAMPVNRKIQSATMHFFHAQHLRNIAKAQCRSACIYLRGPFLLTLYSSYDVKSAAQCLINKWIWTQLSNHYVTGNKWIFGVQRGWFPVPHLSHEQGYIANVKISPKLWVADISHEFSVMFLGACVANNQINVGVHLFNIFASLAVCTLCCQYQFGGTLQIFNHQANPPTFKFGLHLIIHTSA